MSHLGLQNLVPLWGQVVHDTHEGSFQGHSTNEQNGQHHIGERGREVHHLRQDTGSMDSSRTLSNPPATSLTPATIGFGPFSAVALCYPSLRLPSAQEGERQGGNKPCLGRVLAFPEDLTPRMRQRKTTTQETPRQPRRGSRTSPKFPMSSDSFSTYSLGRGR